jgi:hypothetical protein
MVTFARRQKLGNGNKKATAASPARSAAMASGVRKVNRMTDTIPDRENDGRRKKT